MAQSPTREAGFRRMFDEHFIDIRSYCLRRLPVADANDAVSEVFLVAWRRRGEAPLDVRPWLFTIARNVVRNSARSSMRARRLLVRVQGEPGRPVPGPEVQIVRNAEDAALADAVQSLPHKYAEVVRLWAWEWLTAPQIAEVVGCSVAAAEKRLSRGLTRLRGSLEHVDSRGVGQRRQR